MKDLKNLAWFTQFALSVVSPLLLFILLSVFLMRRFELGGWVVVLGVVLGVGGAVSGLVSSLRLMTARQDEDGRGDRVSFNDHR